MARDYFDNGPTLVQVKNAVIGSLSELGLADGPIRVTPDFRHRDINVDAWGPEVPAEIQAFLASVNVSMTLVHFDRDVLDLCIRESMGGGSAAGTLPRAGARMGGNVGRFVAGNHFIGLNLSSPVKSKPWRFYFAYMAGPPLDFPLGTERSIVTINWRVVPYATDPYGAGVGAQGVVLWDHTADT